MTTPALNPREPEKERRRVVLTASVSAATTARRAIEGIPELRRLPDVRFVAQVIANELVSNVLRHAGLAAGEAFLLALRCGDRTLRVEVADGGPGFDPLALLRAHLLLERHHRGLSLLNALADRWGFRRGDGEFAVWFELDLVPGRRAWVGRTAVSRS